MPCKERLSTFARSTLVTLLVAACFGLHVAAPVDAQAKSNDDGSHRSTLSELLEERVLIANIVENKSLVQVANKTYASSIVGKDAYVKVTGLVQARMATAAAVAAAIDSTTKDEDEDSNAASCYEERPGIFPDFAHASSYEEFSRGKSEAAAKLARDISELFQDANKQQRSLHACIRRNLNDKAQALSASFKQSLLKLGIESSTRYVSKRLHYWDRIELCDLDFEWSVHWYELHTLKHQQKFPHMIVMEEPWMWRTDPVNQTRLWSFLSWDYLNGLALPENMPNDRWQHYFADHVDVKPWVGPRPHNSVLLIGQVPTDVAVMLAKARYGTDLNGIYRMIVQTVQQQLPGMEIVYRPHPILEKKTFDCALHPIEGVTVKTNHDETLTQAIENAAVVISVSSTSLVQAVLAGIPSIALDYVSPTHSVSCHDLNDLKAAVVDGTACRPDRTQWLANVGYAMWSVDDIINGNVFRYLFNEGGPQQFGMDQNEFTFSSYHPVNNQSSR